MEKHKHIYKEIERVENKKLGRLPGYEITSKCSCGNTMKHFVVGGSEDEINDYYSDEYRNHCEKEQELKRLKFNLNKKIEEEEDELLKDFKESKEEELKLKLAFFKGLLDFCFLSIIIALVGLPFIYGIKFIGEQNYLFGGLLFWISAVTIWFIIKIQNK